MSIINAIEDRFYSRDRFTYNLLLIQGTEKGTEVVVLSNIRARCSALFNVTDYRVQWIQLRLLQAKIKNLHISYNLETER